VKIIYLILEKLVIQGLNILDENINNLIKNLVFLGNDIENFMRNPKNDDFFEEIIKKVEKCDIVYDTIKVEILKILKDLREDIIEVKERDNGLEF